MRFAQAVVAYFVPYGLLVFGLEGLGGVLGEAELGWLCLDKGFDAANLGQFDDMQVACLGDKEHGVRGIIVDISCEALAIMEAEDDGRFLKRFEAIFGRGVFAPGFGRRCLARFGHFFRWRACGGLDGVSWQYGGRPHAHGFLAQGIFGEQLGVCGIGRGLGVLCVRVAHHPEQREREAGIAHL